MDEADITGLPSNSAIFASIPIELDSFRAVSTMRYDPAAEEFGGTKVYLLDLHRKRLATIALACGWDKAVGNLEEEKFCRRVSTGIAAFFRIRGVLSSNPPMKVRILCDFEGKIDLEFAPLSPLWHPLFAMYPTNLSNIPIEQVWEVRVAKMAIRPDFFTQYKTTVRYQYDHARKAMGVGMNTAEYSAQLVEAIVVNEHGQVMEGTISTIYFKRDGLWVTPDDRSGCSLGVTRRYALEHGLCVPRAVVLEDLRDGELMMLSNGARGFFWGKINLKWEK